MTSHHRSVTWLDLICDLTPQISDIAEKLEQAEQGQGAARFGRGYGAGGAGDKGKKGNEEVSGVRPSCFLDVKICAFGFWLL